MKKVAGKGLGFVVAAVLLFAFAQQVGAYCVHNQSDATMHVVQYMNRSFWKPFNVHISPGQQSCCSWTEKDCNKSGGATDTVGFNVDSYGVSDRFINVCNYVTIPANGDLYIKGSKDVYSCSQNP